MVNLFFKTDASKRLLLRRSNAKISRPNTFAALEFVLGCFLACGILCGHVLARPNDTNAYPDLRVNKELFKQFLDNPYPVRDVVFDTPGGSPTKEDTNILVFEGGMQNDTFYVRNDNISMFATKMDTGGRGGEISGQSKSGVNWFISGKAARGTGGETELISTNYSDPTAQTIAKYRSSESLILMRGACWFGFSFLVPHSIVWNGETFQMLWFDSQYPHVTNSYAVTGQIMAYTNNVPLAIRLTSKTWPANYKWVDLNYEYDFTKPDRFYPVNIWANLVFRGNIHVQGTTFQIPTIVFGDANPSEDGYKQADFLPAKRTVPPHSFIYSNGAVYLADDKTPLLLQPPARAIPLITRKYIIEAFLVAFVILPAAIFLAAVVKKRKVNNEKSTESVR
jgi:hypothetical protein